MTVINNSNFEKVAHSIDYVGERYGLWRYDNESLGEFRRRLKDNHVHKSNSSTLNSAFGIARELGGITRKILEINIEAGSSINVTDTHIYFHEDYTEPPSHTVCICSKFPVEDVDTWYYVKDLWDYVDASSYMSMDEPDEETMWLPIRYVVPHSTANHYRPVTLRVGINYVDHKELCWEIAGSGIERKVFDHDELELDGDYYIDHTNNIIYVKHKTQTVFSCIGVFTEKTLNLEYCPVKVYGLADKNYRDAISYRVDGDIVSYGKELSRHIVKAYNYTNYYWQHRNLPNRQSGLTSREQIFNYLALSNLERSYYLTKTETYQLLNR